MPSWLPVPHIPSLFRLITICIYVLKTIWICFACLGINKYCLNKTAVQCMLCHIVQLRTYCFNCLHDPSPIDVPTIAHEVQHKIVSETSIRGRDKLFGTLRYSYTVKKKVQRFYHMLSPQLLQCMSLEVNFHEIYGITSIHPQPGSDIAASNPCIAKESSRRTHSSLQDPSYKISSSTTCRTTNLSSTPTGTLYC